MKALVICVGNAVVGGAGKTPVVMHLAKYLKVRNKKVAIICRGYKGTLSKSAKAQRVLSHHTAAEVGDEALLHANIAPTYICPNRFKAASLAVKEGAKIIIMDDGYQNNTLYISKRILIIDKQQMQKQNGFLLPVGNKREPMFMAKTRADVVLSFNGKYYQDSIAAEIMVTNQQEFKNRKVVILTAIANPEKLSITLNKINAEIVEKFYYPDHHIFAAQEITKVIARANALKAIIATTAKDYIKIPDNLKSDIIKVVKIELRVNDSFIEKL